MGRPHWRADPACQPGDLRCTATVDTSVRRC